MSTKKQSALNLNIDEKGIAWITIDVKGDSQNTIKQSFSEEAETLLDKIEKDRSVQGIIFISGKPNNFISGADISMLNAAHSAEEAADLSRNGHKIFARIESLSMPVISAIHGHCLGGGLELALACSHRIATDENSTRLGLPEVQLGLLPGGGGTQRLPRLVGIASALDMMLTGRQLVARQAKKLGLVDDVVPQANLKKAAEKLLLASVGKVKPVASQMKLAFKPASLIKIPELQKLALETTAYGRKVIFDQAKKTVMKKSRGLYPAPLKIIECVQVGMDVGLEAGLEIEAKNFGDLVVSKEAEQLMGIFFATTELKKETGTSSKVTPMPIERVGVLGGGLMGAGIAYVTADKAGKKVRIKDRDDQGINHALKYCWNIYRKQIKRKKLTINDASIKFAAISGTTSYRGFQRSDLIIEAVFESLDLKQEMVKDIEKICHDKVIFASNTSSIPITQIAKASKRPERVIGLHYFSPVEKMPLLEIVTTDKTSDEVIATCVAFGKQQGKTVIVVKDGAGFYTSRILAPFINEAGQMLAEGVAIEKIDSALKKSGFPVGPLTLLDEVGIDVSAKIAPVLLDAFGERMAPPAIFSKLIDDDRKGRKNGRGLYQYGSKKSGKKQVDESVYSLLDLKPSNEMDKKLIAQRCILMMVNEAAMCLQEGIIKSPRDGDIGAIFGLGFPPVLGGPFKYMDSVGVGEIVEQLKKLEKTCGMRFKPAKILQDYSKTGKSFY
ncbi:MAG: fatty acid oxidation complex subunit alpha FadJ [Gammaproteobacteria bacterium]|nr:fatty acid oxidation complex subunit alpha FadJ [Gammaproteobacteria bacterium]